MTFTITPLEAFAAAASLASVVWAAKASWLTWPSGIIGVLAYTLVFWKVQLYADMGLQAVFLAQSVYGWRLWLAGRGQEARKEAIRSGTDPEIALTVLFVVAMAPLLAMALARWTEASIPLADSTLSMISLAALYWMARKVIFNWGLWIVADVGYVALFLYKGMPVSAVLYAIFLILCVHGMRHWNALKDKNTGTETARAEEEYA